MRMILCTFILHPKARNCKIPKQIIILLEIGCKMTLTVIDYDKIEAHFSANKPNRILEAFRPEHFGLTGYPLRIHSDAELFRYVDVMHELRHIDDYNNILGGFTSDEFSLFKEVSIAVADFTEQEFGKRMVPKGALVRAMISYRHIRFLTSPEDTTILELGPGSGYLGALLAKSGYRYAAMDITQPFYLYQNKLWKHLFGDRLIELASDEKELSDFSNIPEGGILHIPWWKYSYADPTNINLDIDVVTSNHALCEMHRNALHYSANLCGNWLSKQGRVRFFFAEGMGSEVNHSRMQGYKAFTDSGYLHVYRDPLIDIFSPDVHEGLINLDANRQKNHEETKSLEQPPLPPLPHPTGPSIIHKILWLMKPQVASRVIKRAVNILMEPGGFAIFRHKFRQFIGKDTPASNTPLSSWLGPLELGVTLNNIFFQRINLGRKEILNSKLVPYNEVQEIQKEIIGKDDIKTEDESFFQFCFGKNYYG